MSYRNFLLSLFGAASLATMLGIVQPLISAQPIDMTVQAQTTSASMTLRQLESILQSESSELQGTPGQWRATVNGRQLIVLADVANDRMRIVTPVIAASDLSAPQIQAILLANFHTALDARYALSEEAVVAMFVHPLASLDEDYLRSALSQVTTLADNFGTTYNSGELGFGAAGQSEQSAPSGDSLAI